MQMNKFSFVWMQLPENIRRISTFRAKALRVEFVWRIWCLFAATDFHDYLLFSSSHPSHTKRSIPFSQFLRLCRICSEQEDFQAKGLGMRHSFVQHGYPTSLVDTAFSNASQIPQAETLTDPVSNVTGNNKIPLVLSYHLFNFKVRDVIRKNFHILRKRPRNIFHFLQ
jgi:hypothetical protein